MKEISSLYFFGSNKYGMRVATDFDGRYGSVDTETVNSVA